MTTTPLTKTDLDAMTRAIAAARAETRGRARQIDDKLRHESFEDVGRFCAFSAQIESMHLSPWESTVVYADSPEAHALRRRVIAAGLSIYEPFPLESLDRVEPRP